MQIKGGKTFRGDRRYEFKDNLGQACDIQEASYDAMGPAIWLGLDTIGKRMCLTQDQVAALMPYLVYFIENGDLPQIVPTGGDDA